MSQENTGSPDPEVATQAAPREPEQATQAAPREPEQATQASRPSGASTTGRSTRSPRSRSGGRLRLGGGLVEVPVVKTVDPASAVMSDPTVPENKRFCWKCGNPVGRKCATAEECEFGTCPS